MSKLTAAFCFALMCALSVKTYADRLSIIHAGTLIVRADQPSQQQKTLLVRDAVIERIEDGYLSAEELGIAEADDVQSYDLKNRVVMPGFIDGHVHLTLQPVPSRRSLDLGAAQQCRLVAGGDKTQSRQC